MKLCIAFAVVSSHIEHNITYLSTYVCEREVGTGAVVANTVSK